MKLKSSKRNSPIAPRVIAVAHTIIRNRGMPMSLKELCDRAMVDKGKVWRQLKEMDGDGNILRLFHKPFPAEALISKACGKLGAHRLYHRALCIYNFAKRMSSSPRGRASLSIYLACREERHSVTMKEVAEACGVSDYTLREWKRRLCEHPCSPSIRKTAAEEAISERTITKRCY